MQIFKRNAALSLSAVAERKLAFIEIIPAIEDILDGERKTAEELFDYKNSIRSSFTPLEMLKASFKLVQIANGHDLKYEKIKDLSKNDASFVSSINRIFVKLEGDGVNFSITHGPVNHSITVKKDETYAIGMWFQFQAQKFIMTEQ